MTYHDIGFGQGAVKGAKPADLAVPQPTKFELVINAQIARLFGLNDCLLPPDEMIE